MEKSVEEVHTVKALGSAARDHSESNPLVGEDVPITNDINQIAELKQSDGVGDHGDHGDDDGIECVVCQCTDGDPSDTIVFYDGCDLMVHSTCYGSPLINGVPGGAMKPTNDSRWAHIVCALFVREGVDCPEVPHRRWEQSCYVCSTASDCAIDYSELRCPLSFDVTCGLKEQLCIEYREGMNKEAIVSGFYKNWLWKKTG
ncbi:unnamed protein product [Camellia sinensis]